jgi:hypothetical protein
MTVLKQLRAFVAVDVALKDRLKTLGVDVFLAAAGSAGEAEARQHVLDFLILHERAADGFRR